jgi:hypothetical protein
MLWMKGAKHTECRPRYEAHRARAVASAFHDSRSTIVSAVTCEMVNFHHRKIFHPP